MLFDLKCLLHIENVKYFQRLTSALIYITLKFYVQGLENFTSTTFATYVNVRVCTYTYLYFTNTYVFYYI